MNEKMERVNRDEVVMNVMHAKVIYDVTEKFFIKIYGIELEEIIFPSTSL